MKVQKRMVCLTVAAILQLCVTHIALASNFSIEPVRVILDQQHRTERVLFKNESDKSLTVLIKTYRWTQTGVGKDQYSETDDLIIFPRAVTLAAGEERFVRVGLASPSGVTEQAFRMYVEEQPLTDSVEPPGSSVRILMRVGVPVFAQPLKPEPVLNIHEPVIAKGKLQHTLTNSGNAFITTNEITINGIDAHGTEQFSSSLGGAYLLAGSSRTFEVAIPKKQCDRIATLIVTTKSDGKEQQQKTVVSKKSCEQN